MRLQLRWLFIGVLLVIILITVFVLVGLKQYRNTLLIPLPRFFGNQSFSLNKASVDNCLSQINTPFRVSKLNLLTQLNQNKGVTVRDDDNEVVIASYVENVSGSLEIFLYVREGYLSAVRGLNSSQAEEDSRKVIHGTVLGALSASGLLGPESFERLQQQCSFNTSNNFIYVNF